MKTELVRIRKIDDKGCSFPATPDQIKSNRYKTAISLIHKQLLALQIHIPQSGNKYISAKYRFVNFMVSGIFTTACQSCNRMY